MSEGSGDLDSFDVAIVGGSYAGMSAAMSLGRALRRVLVIDNGEPCNSQTPHSHNLITQDGSPPAEIAALARMQVKRYDTVDFLDAQVLRASAIGEGFSLATDTGRVVQSRKLLLASGVRDIMPDIPGFAECWGISILHCPYCHGYEVRKQRIGLLANGSAGYQLARLLHNWSHDLILYTNGASTLSEDDTAKLSVRGIPIVELSIARFVHEAGRLKRMEFVDGGVAEITTMFARIPTAQKTALPLDLGCEMTEHGLIRVDEMQRTSVHGLYAAGDNCWTLRSVANAIGTGSRAGAFINHELISEEF